MADYLIQDTTLDAIADAINTKLDTSVAMTPAQMVTAIGSIPSGGGLPSGVSGVATGTVTVTSAADVLTFTHGLGVIPKAFVVYVTNPWYSSYNTYTLYCALFTTDGTSVRSNVREQTTNNAGLNRYINRDNGSDVGTNTVTICRLTNTQGQFQPTQYTNSDKTTTEALEYRWYAIA